MTVCCHIVPVETVSFQCGLITEVNAVMLFKDVACMLKVDNYRVSVSIRVFFFYYFFFIYYFT